MRETLGAHNLAELRATIRSDAQSLEKLVDYVVERVQWETYQKFLELEFRQDYDAAYEFDELKRAHKAAKAMGEQMRVIIASLPARGEG